MDGAYYLCLFPLLLLLFLYLSVMDNVKLLGDRITSAENSHRQAIIQQRECNNVFRALDRDLNTLRPELMRLQWEKDQYTR